MFSKITLTSLMLIVLLMAGCDKVDESGTLNSGGGNSDEWLVPVNEVFDGGPGKDGIPALNEPDLTTLAKATYLNDNDLVIGYKVGDVIRAYPHKILDWHEIINDNVNNSLLAVTYCPLTGSGIGWNRTVSGGVTTFGVSGSLYNTNLMPYDRKTNSTWSQMSLLCVNGELVGEMPELIPLVETTWQTWQELYPSSMVVSTNTGFNRSYGSFPYGSYRTNHSYLLFPINNDDSRLNRKVRVLGVAVDNEAKAYPISNFAVATEVITENIGGQPIVVAGSSGKNFAVAYKSKLSDGTVLTFTAVQDELPVIMIDNEGTKWDLFGEAVLGTRAGTKLEEAYSYIAYWFAWAAFNPETAIYGM